MYANEVAVDAPESNMAHAAKQASRSLEGLADVISSLRDRLKPVLVSAGPECPPTNGGVSAVEPAAAAVTYEFRGLQSRADSLRAQVEDILRRLDV